MKGKVLICIMGLAIASVLAGCGKEEDPGTGISLAETTKYEHIVTGAAKQGEDDGETHRQKDAEGYYVVQDTVYVRSNTLNIRRQPSTESEIVSTVNYGTSLNRTGIGEDDWVRIYYQNETAYVSKSLVTELTILEDKKFEPSKAVLSTVDTSREFYSYDSMCGDLAELKERFSDHMRLNCIGTTKDNRNIFEVIIGNPDTAKKQLFFCAGVCGTEYMSTLVCMKQIEYYLTFYEKGNYKGFPYKELCDNVAIHVIPMLNPDGVMISQDLEAKISRADILSDLNKWFKRDKQNGGTSLSKENYLKFFYANANGVDLRRNFDYMWDQVSADLEAGSEGYRGTEPATEPESRALLAQISRYSPDLIIVYHTSGPTIQYNFGQDERKTANAKKYAELLEGIMNYEKIDSAVGVEGFGSYEGYCNKELGIPTMSVYLGSGKTPLALNEFNAIWNACCDSWAVMQLAVIDY